MTAPEPGFYSAVTGDVTVAALIDTRLYPVILPADKQLPAATYQIISRVVLGGICYQERIQLSLYATSYSGLKALRDAVQGLAEKNVNWQYVEGADNRDDDEGVFRQTVDVIIT